MGWCWTTLELTHFFERYLRFLKWRNHWIRRYSATFEWYHILESFFKNYKVFNLLEKNIGARRKANSLANPPQKNRLNIQTSYEKLILFYSGQATNIIEMLIRLFSGSLDLMTCWNLIYLIESFLWILIDFKIKLFYENHQSIQMCRCMIQVWRSWVINSQITYWTSKVEYFLLELHTKLHSIQNFIVNVLLLRSQ